MFTDRDIPAPPSFRLLNPVGVWSLYLKEVRRFLNVYTQTIVAPVVTTLLFLAVFALALGGAVQNVNGVPFLIFLTPGLIVMAMAQNAFANTSSSLVISKIQGNIVDVLMPPIAPGEFVFAYALAGMTRGIVVGLVTWAGMALFVPLPVSNIWLILYHAAMASLMLSLLGMLGGIWSEKFDQIAAVTNFVITPFSFLSGTFYSVSRLPEPFHTLAFYNPFFYMIDGFRGGVIGVHDVAPLQGVLVMAGVNLVLWLAVLALVQRGYRLKT